MCKYFSPPSIIVAVAIFIVGIAVGASVTATEAAPGLAQRLSGRILLQVQQRGEAWYVYPKDLKRYYLGTAEDAYLIMRELGLGITDKDLSAIPIGKGAVAPSDPQPQTQTTPPPTSEPPSGTTNKTVTKRVGELVEFATLDVTVNAVQETNILASDNPYVKTAVAPPGAKFVVVDMTVKNKTSAAMRFDADDGFQLFDDKGRVFTEYDRDSSDGGIWFHSNELDGKDLLPSIAKQGRIYYQVPTDALAYKYSLLKAGTNETYEIILK